MKTYVQDRFGNDVYLTDERWRHIVQRHGVLASFRAEILKTIRSGKRLQDADYPDTFFYQKAVRGLPHAYTHIEVVVLFRTKNNSPNNFVLTAYPITKR